MAVTLAYDPVFLEHDTGPGHVERPDRLRAVLDLLEQQPWQRRLQRVAPREAKGDELRGVHEVPMMLRSRDLALEGGGSIDADTVVSAKSWEAALKAAGAVIDGARAVARGDAAGAYCLVRPPGHHATPGQAMGFCLLNNVAVAAHRVLGLKSARRVAIFDHDVHHGNGTQDAFYASPDVLYVSVHQWPLYPGTGRVEEVGEGEGAGFNVNLPVPAGTGEQAYMQLLDQVVLPVAESFAPDLWIVSAGYDSHRQDLLGSLALTSNSYPAILRKLAEVKERFVVALEGGYHLDAVARSAVGQMGGMLGANVTWDEKPPEERTDVRGLVKESRRVLGEHWRL